MPKLESVKKIAEQLKAHIAVSEEKLLEKNIGKAETLPDNDLLILCRYFSAGFVCSFFGGNVQSVRKKIIRIDQRKLSHEDLTKQTDLTELIPFGVGGWDYARRLSLSVIQSLEQIVNEGIKAHGQSTVQACKALLEQVEKIKQESFDEMQNCQNQLLILAEFIVDNFLSLLSEKIKTDFNNSLSDLLDNIELIDQEDFHEAVKVRINKLKRRHGMKSFEILFAETMAENAETSQAFDLTIELIENFMKEKK